MSDRPADWHREGGAGLPPAANAPDTDGEREVWLFSCPACGERIADPPGLPADGCPCGGEYVVHRFDPDDYQRIRRFGDPRERGGAGE